MRSNIMLILAFMTMVVAWYFALAVIPSKVLWSLAALLVGVICVRLTVGVSEREYFHGVHR